MEGTTHGSFLDDYVTSTTAGVSECDLDNINEQQLQATRPRNEAIGAGLAAALSY
jgi:hypothetical protein